MQFTGTPADAFKKAPRLASRLYRRAFLAVLNRSAIHAGSGGRRIRLPLLWSEHGDLARYRPGWKAQLITSLLSSGEGACFLDIGVNRGQTLLDFLSAGVDADYIGFEPDPEAAAFVRRLIQDNRLSRCTLCPFALAERNGAAQLFTRAGVNMDASATIRADLRPTWTNLRADYIALCRLDDLWSAYFPARIPSLIKIDVEGAELGVLRGMTKLLNDWRPMVMCEVLLASPDADVAQHEAHHTALESLLRDHDYLLFLIIKGATEGSVDGLKLIPQLRRGAFKPQLAHECDYLFVPRSRLPDIENLRFGPLPSKPDGSSPS